MTSGSKLPWRASSVGGRETLRYRVFQWHYLKATNLLSQRSNRARHVIIKPRDENADNEPAFPVRADSRQHRRRGTGVAWKQRGLEAWRATLSSET